MGKKDAYYFSHDANARFDVKCIRLRREMGLEGYGIYWCLIEMLREEESYKLPLSIIEDIAFSLNISREKTERVIKEFELFEFDSDSFFSSRLLRSMEEYKQKKERLSEAGRKGGYGKAKARPEQPSGIKEKESKEKEIKENERENTSPHSNGLLTIDECNELAKKDEAWLRDSGYNEKWQTQWMHKLKATGETNKTLSDFKDHFYNWKRKQPGFVDKMAFTFNNR